MNIFQAISFKYSHGYDKCEAIYKSGTFPGRGPGGGGVSITGSREGGVFITGFREGGVFITEYRGVGVFPL